jgi:hypothetical protein
MWRKLPLIGDVVQCTLEDYVDAIKELLTILFFSFMPIWLGLLFASISAKGTIDGFVKTFLNSGEALLISAGLVGPLIYVLTKKYGDLPRSLTMRFPQGWFFTLSIFAICVIAGAVFGAERGMAPQTIADQSRSTGGELLSKVMLIASIVIVFLVSAIRNHLDRGAPEAMRADTNRFLREWRDR